MKKIISLLVSLTLILSIVPMTVMAEGTGWDGVTTATEYAGGSGTSASPYLISNAAQLAYARDKINDGTDTAKYFKLTADIDLNNQEWVPIGIKTHTFTGIFYGDKHKISNIKITTVYEDGTGFFGHIAGGKVQNLGIENLDMDIPSGNVGGMAGKAYGTFTNCYVKNSSVRNTNTETNQYSGIGGFIGHLWSNITATNCYVYNTEIAGPPRAKMSGFCGTDGGTTDTSVFTNCYVADVTVVPETDAKTPSIYGFAQKQSSTDATSAVNCFSTVVSGVGTYPESNTGFLYTSERELGLSGATKEGIITALVTDGSSYIIDENVNNGYPCLDYEKTALVAANAYAGGTGSTTDPYQIATAEQLMYARDMINSKTHNTKSFILIADLTLRAKNGLL